MFTIYSNIASFNYIHPGPGLKMFTFLPQKSTLFTVDTVGIPSLCPHYRESVIAGFFLPEI